MQNAIKLAGSEQIFFSIFNVAKYICTLIVLLGYDIISVHAHSVIRL